MFTKTTFTLLLLAIQLCQSRVHDKHGRFVVFSLQEHDQRGDDKSRPPDDEGRLDVAQEERLLLAQLPNRDLVVWISVQIAEHLGVESRVFPPGDGHIKVSLKNIGKLV